VDMASMSAHKIFGPKGIGFLYKNAKVNIVPLIHGSGKFNDLRSGTPPLPLVVALSKACRIALTDIEKREANVKKLNDKICADLEKYDGVILNKTKYSIPHILNISFTNIRPETFIHAMEDDEVYISTNTACSSGDLSTSVMAIYNDKRRAMSTIRISLSYVTTNEEINKFLNLFKMKYNQLNSLVKDGK
ncbi:MAG: aminotransferase class V-fold PLP-dependent enzyme, partial [Bacilli bacterium]|nr:aminotransferase class V-fold PLP-dependent enzyme [Bacilli bacterium]